MFSIPLVFEVEILMLFLICNYSVKSTTSSVAIFQRASLSVLPSCNFVLLLGQACSAQLNLLHSIFTSLQWKTALLNSLLSWCVGSRDFFLKMLVPQSRQVRLLGCKLWLFCDVQGRSHSLPAPSYRTNVCLPVYMLASI